MSGRHRQADGKGRLEDVMEQSFVHTESHDDAPLLSRHPKRERGAPKVAADKRKLKPGLY